MTILTLCASILAVMSETTTSPTHYEQPNYNKRRTVAGLFLAPIAAVAAFELFAPVNRAIDRADGLKTAEAQIQNPALTAADHIRKMRIQFGPNARVWSAAEKYFPNEDPREASDAINTYLPGKNHFVQPNQALTVEVNANGDVVPNPNSGDSH